MATKPASIPTRIVNAAMKLAAERPWSEITLGEIAAAAKVTLAQLHDAYPSKTAVLGAVMAKADAAVLRGIDPSALSEPPRERLLDALMRRIEALAPYKPAVASVLRSLSRDPLAALCAAPDFLNSMMWTLEAAGIRSTGLGGRLRVKGLAAIYLSTVLVWLRDDSPELGRTMAHLDRRLRQAERLLVCLPGGRGQDADSAAEA